MTPMLQHICCFALQRGYSQAAFDAALLYIKRKLRLVDPPGRFDKAGRFYLAEPMGQGVRSPSRAYPYSEMVHARTACHCAYLHRVPELHVKRLARAIEHAKALEPGEVSHHEFLMQSPVLGRMLKRVPVTASPVAA